jgi:hypothetical protein
MGRMGLLFFGEKDRIIIDEIAKMHNLPKEVVEKHYVKMLEEVKNDVQVKTQD